MKVNIRKTNELIAWMNDNKKHGISFCMQCGYYHVGSYDCKSNLKSGGNTDERLQ